MPYGIIICGSNVQQSVHLQSLTAAGAAVQPKSKAGVGGGVLVRMVKLYSCPGAGNCDADGVAPGVNRRRVGVIERGPTPVLPAVFQRVVVDDLVGACGHGEKGYGQQA